MMFSMVYCQRHANILLHIHLGRQYRTRRQKIRVADHEMCLSG
jgi:hypothetical protein